MSIIRLGQSQYQQIWTGYLASDSPSDYTIKYMFDSKYTRHYPCSKKYYKEALQSHRVVAHSEDTLRRIKNARQKTKVRYELHCLL